MTLTELPPALATEDQQLRLPGLEDRWVGDPPDHVVPLERGRRDHVRAVGEEHATGVEHPPRRDQIGIALDRAGSPSQVVAVPAGAGVELPQAHALVPQLRGRGPHLLVKHEEITRADDTEHERGGDTDTDDHARQGYALVVWKQVAVE